MPITDREERVRLKTVTRSRTSREQLKQSYIAAQLQIPVKECPPELIKLKRAHMKVLRSLKELNEKHQ